MGKDLHRSIRPFIEQCVRNHNKVQDVQGYEAEDYYYEVIAYEEEQERLQEEMDEKVIKYIKSLSKDELRQKLYEVLYEAPEWMFERFYRDNIEW